MTSSHAFPKAFHRTWLSRTGPLLAAFALLGVAALLAAPRAHASVSGICGDGILDQGEECDDGNTADGDCCSSSCLAETGNPCADDSNPCTVDACNSDGVCAHVAGNPGAVCRQSAGDCDEAETCDGVNVDCPSDAYKPSTFICRDEVGECDEKEFCTGFGPQCPPDKLENEGKLCRGAAGPCDKAEFCDGTSALCPPDEYEDSSKLCRGENGPCDKAEYCTGSSGSCPANEYEGSSKQCRGASGPCDKAEYCTGQGSDCPDDGYENEGTPCENDENACTVEQCDGRGSCQFVGMSQEGDCEADCGTGLDEACSVVVTKPKKPAQTFGSLQQAVKAATAGSTITISGHCTGPVLVQNKPKLIIQGIAPESGCPGDGLRPGDLSSTVSSATDAVIKIVNSPGAKVQFLNVVDGPFAGIEFQKTSTGTAFCNCVTRNFEGIELQSATSGQVLQNLVRHNSAFGIRLHKGPGVSSKNMVRGNEVEKNGDDGIRLEVNSSGNTVTQNSTHDNADDGIGLNNVSKNTVTENDVARNGDLQIDLTRAVKNKVDLNTVDGVPNGPCDCVSGSGNTGGNVPPACH